MVSMDRGSSRPQSSLCRRYYSLQGSIGSPPHSIGLDGEPETIKRVCCEAAPTPRTFMTPSIAFGSLPLALGGWRARNNKKSLLRSSINSQDFYDPPP